MQGMPPEHHMVPIGNSHQAVYQIETGMDSERKRDREREIASRRESILSVGFVSVLGNCACGLE